MSHDLVIGGSGMLADLCLRLADGGRRVTVVARNPVRLNRLAQRVRGSGAIFGVAADYGDRPAFRAALVGAVAQSGPPDRVVCWMHGDIASAGPLDAAAVAAGSFWHVLGSAHADPARPETLLHWRSTFSSHVPALRYHQIILGFMIEAVGSRWLTHEEISHGVADAIAAGQAVATVGAITPWSLRP